MNFPIPCPKCGHKNHYKKPDTTEKIGNIFFVIVHAPAICEKCGYFLK